MIEYKEQKISTEDYLMLRLKVGWKKLTERQAKLAVDNALCMISVYDGDKLIGMGRLVGDGSVIVYIQDLIVLPEYRGRGIGGEIVELLKKKAMSFSEEGEEIMLCLMCAKGREKFYERHNFIARPTDYLGPGMIQYLIKPRNCS